MVMELGGEDWIEFFKFCFTLFGIDSFLGGFFIKGFGEDLKWKLFCFFLEILF